MSREAYYAAIEERLRSALQGLHALRVLDSQPTPVARPEPTSPAPAPVQPSPEGFIGEHGFPDERGVGLFADQLRSGSLLGPVLDTGEWEGCQAILSACAREALPLSHAAYCLGTAYHEVSGTMQPIHERGGRAYLHRMYDIQGARPQKARELGNVNPGDGVKFAGRGYPQLTGRSNYKRAGEKLGLNLIANPDLMLQPPVAALVMARGMREGWFTSRKLSDYLPSAVGTRPQFKQARRIVNGQDRADDIAGYALHFQTALQAGGWR